MHNDWSFAYILCALLVPRKREIEIERALYNSKMVKKYFSRIFKWDLVVEKHTNALTRIQIKTGQLLSICVCKINIIASVQLFTTKPARFLYLCMCVWFSFTTLSFLHTKTQSCVCVCVYALYNVSFCTIHRLHTQKCGETFAMFRI